MALAFSCDTSKVDREVPDGAACPFMLRPTSHLGVDEPIGSSKTASAIL